MFKKKLMTDDSIQAIVDGMGLVDLSPAPSPVPQKNVKPFRIPDIIMKKRNGEELTQDEINFFVASICDLNNNKSQIQESQIGEW
jgi:hypothetical protein